MKEITVDFLEEKQLNKALRLLEEKFYNDWCIIKIKWNGKACTIFYETDEQLDHLRYCWAMFRDKGPKPTLPE